jgi:hypothetical protein
VDAEYSYPKISLVGQNTILGRSLVIHADADNYGRESDEASTSSGNSGAKVGCCIIEEVPRLPEEEDDSLIVPIRAAHEVQVERTTGTSEE